MLNLWTGGGREQAARQLSRHRGRICGQDCPQFRARRSPRVRVNGSTSNYPLRPCVTRFEAFARQSGLGWNSSARLRWQNAPRNDQEVAVKSSTEQHRRPRTISSKRRTYFVLSSSLSHSRLRAKFPIQMATQRWRSVARLHRANNMNYGYKFLGFLVLLVVLEARRKACMITWRDVSPFTLGFFFSFSFLTIFASYSWKYQLVWILVTTISHNTKKEHL